MDHAFVQELGYKNTSFGRCLYLKIRRYDEQPMPWSEVWATFADRYPGKWAVQFFPPARDLVDEANIYHLFVLEEAPDGVNNNR
jgi:hypothetical protein